MNNFAPHALTRGDFRKSSFSTDTADPHCVYVAHLAGHGSVEFRDSKRGLDTPGFTVSPAAFQSFVTVISAD
jgi:hypothetical protein